MLRPFSPLWEKVARTPDEGSYLAERTPHPSRSRFAMTTALPQGRGEENAECPMKFFSFWRSLASFRVRIALNLKNVPAEVVFVDLDANAHRDAEYRKINPQMALPALVEDDGTTLFQSLAILEYLDEKYPSPPLLPADIARPRPRPRAGADGRLRGPSAAGAAGAALSRPRTQSARHPAGGVAAALDRGDAGRAGGTSR